MTLSMNIATWLMMEYYLTTGDLPDKDADLVGCSHGWLALHVSKRSRL